MLSFPHNPTTVCVDLEVHCSASSTSPVSTRVLLVHDFAYADLGFDGDEPPSTLQVPGLTDVAVELCTLTKSFSMAGLADGLRARQRWRSSAALAELKSYLDYCTFQLIQIAATVVMKEDPISLAR